MRFHRPLDDLLRNRTSVRVLRVLVRSPAKEFTGRELAVEAGASPPNTILELNRLRGSGLVERRTAGPSQLWRLRRMHEFAGPLRALFDAEARLPVRLRQLAAERFASVAEVVRVVLFGSSARGDERPDSDVDVLVVVGSKAISETVREAVEDLREAVQGRFGNRLSPVVQTAAEFSSRRAAALRKSIEREGVVLWERRP